MGSLDAAELMLDEGLSLVCRVTGRNAPFRGHYPVYLLLEAADHDDPTERLGVALEGVAEAFDWAVASDVGRRRELWAYREDHTLAINTLGPPHKLDVTVPMARLEAFVDDVNLAIRRVQPRARIFVFGHVGDGNVHVNVTGVDPDDTTVDDAILRLVAELGGSISAEHGIGTAKKPWLHLSRTAEEIAAFRAIKRALDPAGILNPNVLLP
jgi:FAD/FMN-containing dehydrogenase